MFLSRFIPPEGFSVGPFYIHIYSLTMLAAVWSGYFLALHQAKKIKLPREYITDAVLVVVLSGVVGARIGYVVQNISHFRDNLLEAFQLYGGGLSIHGAIVAAVLALYVFARKREISFFKLTDCFALPLLLGQIIGRLGNYFNQELFGYPADVPWKLLIESDKRPIEYAGSEYFHPTFLYEMILNAIGLIILSRIPFKKEGQLTASYLIVFATSRFIAEIFRISDRLAFSLSLAQVISLVIVPFSLIFLTYLSRRDKVKSEK